MKKVYSYIKAVFFALFAMVSFVACSSDDDSQQIYTKGVLDWEDTTGTLTYSITNVNTGKTIYSRTFSSDDGGNQIPKPPKWPK